MAGLTVILETHKSHHPYHHRYHTTTTTTSKGRPHILVKASMLRQHHLAPSPPQPLPLTTMPSSSFLQSCYLCRGHLSQEKDIYMYRGDRAFCSVECRRNQILMDEESIGGEKTNSNVAASTCVSHHRKGAI